MNLRCTNPLCQSVLVYLLSVVFFTNACGEARAANDRLNRGVIQSLSDVKRYQQSHDITELRQAVYDIGGAADPTSLTPSNFVAQRRILVSGYVEILLNIEKAYDPTYDPDEIRACPVPPRYSGSDPNLMPCTDPANVTDHDARVDYAAKLSAYRKWQRQATYYMQINQIDALAMGYLRLSLQHFARIAPASVPNDFSALSTIARNSGLSEKRIELINPLFIPNVQK